MRRPSPRPAALGAALAALLAASPAAAVDVGEGKLTIHGDGQWAYQRTTSGNTLGEATPEGNYDTAMFDLVLTARPVEDLVISAQLGFDPEGAGLEWGFAEWRFSERARLRVGKVQQPIGNLNELRFAGTTRTFYDLPHGVYGPSNMVGTAYQGVGLTGQVATDGGWTVAYDLYGGAVMLAELEGYRGLEGQGTTEPLEPQLQQARDMLGGRLSVTTPGDLVLRASGYGGHLEKDHDESDGFYVWGLSVQYRTDRLWASGEFFRSVEVGSEAAWTAYGSFSWFFTEHVQAAVRYELQRTSLDAYAGSSPLLRHDQLTLGLNYWVNPSMVLKGSYAMVEGNRFALPEGATTASVVTPGSEPDPRTGVIIVGAQFAF